MSAFSWVTGIDLYNPYERSFFHLFCKRVLSACLPFPDIQNAAATTARTQRPGARASVSARVRGGRRCPGRSPRSPGRSPQPQRRPARARGLYCPTHEHTHTHGNAGFPRPRRWEPAGALVGAEGGSSRRGGCPGAALVHTLLGSRSPAPVPPSPSPARGLRAPQVARVRARAQARALRGRPRRLQRKRRKVPD